MKTLKQGSAACVFCEIPLALAEATVTIIEHGLPKVNFFLILAFKTTSHGYLQNQLLIDLISILVLFYQFVT